MILMSACVRPLRMPERDLLSISRIASAIESQKSNRRRLSGIYRARATGIKQFFGQVDLTVAFELPSSFYISIPSFFGMPARVVTGDGRNLYLLDLSGGEALYLIEPSTSETLEKWLGFRIAPRNFVYALLGVVDLQNAVVVDTSLTRNRTRYEVRLKYPDGSKALVELSTDTDDLLSQRVFNDEGKQVYRVDYADFRESRGGRFPWKTTISLERENEALSLTLVGEELNFEEQPFDLTTFQIEEP